MSLRRILDRIFPARVIRREHAEWAGRGFAAPSPSHIKRATLLRLGLPEATWIETGTFMGDTTALLARRARRVHSIEPEPKLCARAKARFASTPNVEIHGGISEEVLPGILARLEGDVCFWLDGHYSAGVTFKGPKDTPIAEELAAIEAAAPRLGQIIVLVDDIRCFDPAKPEFVDYPSKAFLIAWAERLGFSWHIEQDIFVARR